MRKQSGFSLIELMIGGGLLAGLALGGAQMFQNQQRAMRGLLGKVEINTIRNNMVELMKNENNCVATVREAFGTPPNMNQTLNLNRIMTVRNPGPSQTIVPFYEVGRVYDGVVKITSIQIRPYDGNRDQTPGHKFSVGFEIMGSILGNKNYLRKSEFFFDTSPGQLFAGYNFRCAAGASQNVTLPDIQTLTLNQIPCGNTFARATGNFVRCPMGKKVLSCGIQDLGRTGGGDEDMVSCFIDTTAQECIYTYDINDVCDSAGYKGYCHCV